MKKTDLLAVILICFALPAKAYENQCTHPVLTAKGITLLETAEERRSQELRQYQFKIVEWVEREDEYPLPTVVYNHFFNPRNFSRLVVGGLPSRIGLTETEDAATRAERDFGKALKEYKAGHKEAAYENLGRAIHLIQDMHQPGHVHNDAHIPPARSLLPFGWLQNLLAAIPGLGGLGGIDESPLEKVVESRCFSQSGSNIPGGTAFATGENRLNFDPAFSDFAFFLSAAEKTYRASSFHVDLPSATIGTLTAVDILGNPIEIEFMEADANSSSACFRKRHWQLKTGGTGLCYDPTIRYDGDVAQKFPNDWWEVLPDASAPDVAPPVISDRRIYIEKYDQVATGSGYSLNEQIMITELPAAVEMTASYIRLFKRQADAKAPDLVDVREGNVAGASIASGQASSVNSIYIEAVDNTNASFPVSSGIHFAMISCPDSSYSDTQQLNGDVHASVVFSGLPEGACHISILDGFGNPLGIDVRVDALGGPQPVDSPDPSDPSQPPNTPIPPITDPTTGVEIGAKTGESGTVCAGAGASGHRPICVRTPSGTPYCYQAPQKTLCVDWACSGTGTYDIPIEFQDDRGNWRRTHTIHCVGSAPQITSCSQGSCHTVPAPVGIGFDTRYVVASVTDDVGGNCGRPIACKIGEGIGGGTCSSLNGMFGGCVGIKYERTYAGLNTAAAGLFYNPPPEWDLSNVRNAPTSVGFVLRSPATETQPPSDEFIDSFGYPHHGFFFASIKIPVLGQPWTSCSNSNNFCISSSGSGGGGGGGGGGGPPFGYPPPPQIDTNPPSPAMQSAAASLGRAIVGQTAQIGYAPRILTAPLSLQSVVQPPPYQPATGASAYSWTGSNWQIEGAATSSCNSGVCTLTASLLHASTWAFLAPLPANYPDLTAPELTNIQISENGVAWNTPGQLIQSSSPSVRLTGRDPPSGIELVSGIAVSSVPLPFTSTDPSLVLHLHLDEGTGSQLIDSGPNYATGTINLTPVWVPGRFGSSLEFDGMNGQQASAPVGTRVDEGPFSVEAWVYPTNNVNNHQIAGKGTAVNRAFGFLVANGHLQAGMGDGTNNYSVTAPDTLPLNQWSLVAMSFDGTKLRIFANGEQKGEVLANYGGSDSTVVIGSLWVGRLDEIRILSRALDRAEAALDYRRGFVAFATGDGWQTSRLATQFEYGGLSEGQAGPAVLTASGFALARSTYSTFVEMAVADVDGHISSTSFQVPVAPPDTTPLSFSSAEISTNSATWYPRGAIPAAGLTSFRVKVKDPVSGPALRSGVETSTASIPFTPDPYTQLLLHLDEGSGSFTLDSSGRASAITLQNGPTWVPGRFGSALSFTDDYQYILPAVNPGGLDVPNWTLSIWVYPTETANGGIFYKINDARYGFSLRGSGGRPELNVHNSVNGFAGGVTVTAPDVLPLNQWTFLTATSDPSVIRLYVNGELKASAAGYMEPNSAQIVIGSGGGGPPFWKGRLDEVRFMSRPQSPDEVLLDYRRGYAALFSSNAGATWSAPAMSLGAAARGDLSATLAVSSLTLANSLSNNLLQIFAADAAGNVSSATYVLPAGADATAPAPPVIVSTRLAANGSARIAWQPDSGEVPVSYDLYRATEPIVSLAGLLPVATTSGVCAFDTPSFSLGDTFYYALTAADLQGNVGAPSASVETFFDHSPPITTLTVQGASATASGIIYALPTSTLSVGAADLGTAVSGVAGTALSVDGNPVLASTAPFHLAEGLHYLAYFSTDAAGNVETARVSTVAVDGTAPVSTFTVTGGSTRDSLDRAVIVAGQAVNLTAQDTAAGVGAIVYRVDTGTWSVVTGTVAVPEGQHVLQFYAVDLLGNAEAPHSQAFVVALAPTEGVAVVSPTENSFTVQWSSMTNAVGYVVLVSSVSDFSAVSFSTAVENQQVTVTGLEASTTYFVRVAFFSESNDGLSVTVTALTSAAPVPILRIWTGAAGDGLWTSTGNWSPAGVPTAIDTAMIDSAATVTVPATATATVAALNLGNPSGFPASTLIVDGVLRSSGSAIVYGGATLVSNTNDPLFAGSWEFRAGALATHVSASISRQPVLHLQSAGDLTVYSGASLDLDARGYPGADYASGIGPGGGCVRGAGGGHGGQGGNGECSGIFGSISAAYDSISDPRQPGSSGGAGRPDRQGGAGGGVVILEVGGNLTVDGSITARGIPGGAPGGNPTGGGGGGSINIIAGNVHGSGTLNADGGNATAGTFSGGGGGGRIAITATTSDDSSWAVSAKGGAYGSYGFPFASSDGGAGTIYRKRPGQSGYDLAIIGRGTENVVKTPLAGGVSADNMIVSAAAASADDGASPISVSSGLTLVEPWGLYASTLTVAMSTVPFTVPASSTFSVSVPLLGDGRDWNVEGRIALSRLAVGRLTVSGYASITDLTAASFDLLPNAQLILGTAAFSAPDATAMVPSGATLRAQSLSMPGERPWTVAGTAAVGSTINASSFLVEPGARLEAFAALFPVSVYASGDITVQSGGVVFARGLGYYGRASAGGDAGAGPGGGVDAGSGGAHGGRGGLRNGGLSLSGVYDDPADPTMAGSAGGGAASLDRNGNSGGGIVLLRSSGTITIDGLIDASGNGWSPSVLGAGAGGAINLRALRLAGSGALKADGGDGEVGTVDGNAGGGGGRVGLVAASSDVSHFAITAVAGAQTVLNGRLPEAGTIYRLPAVAVSTDGAAGLVSWNAAETITPISTASMSAAYGAAVSGGLRLVTPYLYELSPSPIVFTPPAQLSFQFDPTGVDTNTVAIYRFNDPSWSSAQVSGQSISILGSTTARISGYLGGASLYAVFVPVTGSSAPSLSVSTISPSSATTGTSVSVAVAGTDFDSSAVLSLERADVLRGTWTATGSFAEARFAGTLTKMRDGRVLLAGGMHEGSAAGLTEADVFNPETGVWTAVPAMSIGRNQSEAVLLADGRVLVAGGGNGGFTATAEIYDPALNAWSAAAPMAHARAGFGFERLPDGRVLAAGGWDGSSTLTSAEIYDPAANTWSAAGGMSVGRFDPAMTVLNNGKVLISGGNNDGGTNATAEIYDPAANSWNPAAAMNVARYFHRQALLPSGKVLASGGGNSGGSTNSAEVYDPTANTWSPTGAMSAARYIHALVTVNGTALEVGGENQSTDLASSEIYDAATNAWRSGPSLTSSRAWPMAVVLDDGRVLVAGGRHGLGGGTNLNTAELLGSPTAQIFATGLSVADPQHLGASFNLTGAPTGGWDVVVRESGGREGRLDGGFQVLAAPAPTLSSIAVNPATDSIEVGSSAQFTAVGTFSDGSTRAFASTAGNWLAKAALNAARTGAAGAFAAGKFYAIGGALQTSVEAYDPAANSWAGRAAAPLSRAYAQATELDGKIYVAGGCVNADCGNVTGDLWMYDPAANSWTQKASMTSPRFHLVLEAINGKLYAAGGLNSSFAATGDLEVYDPGANSWQPKAAMTLPRGMSAGGVINGKLYVSGGGDSSAATAAELQIYDPISNTWSSGQPQPIARQNQKGAVQDGKLYAVGGVTAAATEADGARTFIYDGAADSWSEGPALSTARYGPAMGAGAGKIYVAGAAYGNVNSQAVEILAPSSEVAWSIDASSVAFVSGNGLATGQSAGTAHVIASTGAVSGQATLIVTPHLDTLPPVLAIGISTPSFASTSGVVTMATQAAVTLTAVDQASGTTPSGVASILYAVDASTPNVTYSASFTIAVGTHTIYYSASDATGNQAAISSVAVVVTSGPAIASVTPSSAAIGVPFTLTGFNFRARNTTKSLVLFDHSTGTITSWNDTTIVGKVPGLATATYSLSVVAFAGSTQASPGIPFDVIVPRLDSIAPSAGPAGITAFLYGGNFGPLDSTRTQVLFAGATAQVNTWSDSVIKVDVPAVSTGAVAVQVRRRSLDGGEVLSNALYFTMEGMILTAVSPSTGPVGRVVTLTGADFGPIDGVNTRVRFGASTGTVVTWTDTQVTAAVPYLATGTYSVSLERVAATSTTISTFVNFDVTPLLMGAVNQSSGPIGTILTVTGSGYGPSDTTRTRVVYDGVSAGFTTWNDTTIAFRIPGSTEGAHAFHFERQARNGGVQKSDDGYFTVATPQLYAVAPSSAPIGQANVILTGFGLGAKDGSRTRVMFGSTSAVVATWTDAAAKVTVPPMMATGTYALTLERESLDGMTVVSSSVPFTILRPTISTIAPNFGLANALITMTGTGFGASLGAAKSQILIGGTTAQFTVWNDTTIKWKVPATLANGTYTVTAVRQPTGGFVESNGVPFTVGSFALASFGFAAPTALAAQPDQNFEAGMSLPADEGGRVESVALAAVAVPANALSEDTELTIKRLHTDGFRSAAAEAAKVKAAGEPIEFGPEGTRFNTPVTIELPYDVALAGDESKLTVNYYDPLRRVWESLPSVVDRTRHVVTALTDHFSIYQPMGLAPTTVAQDEFYFRDQYAFPNPSRGGALVTFRIQPGLAETVEVRVYDLSGRKIHDSSDFTFLGAIDDGNGKGAQNTYDHTWSVNGVGSGVYTYVIKASRAGQKPIVKSGKVGVIR